jgi:TolB-like protein
MRVLIFAFSILLLSNCVSTHYLNRSPVKTIADVPGFLPMQAKLQVVLDSETTGAISHQFVQTLIEERVFSEVIVGPSGKGADLRLAVKATTDDSMHFLMGLLNAGILGLSLCMAGGVLEDTYDYDVHLSATMRKGDIAIGNYEATGRYRGTTAFTCLHVLFGDEYWSMTATQAWDHAIRMLAHEMKKDRSHIAAFLEGEYAALPPRAETRPAAQTDRNSSAAGGPASQPVTLGGKQHLAVLEFQSRGFEDDVLMALSDTVRGGVLQGLQGHGVAVMTRENMQVLLKDMGKQECEEGDCEVETARNIGADYVVSGKVVRVEKTYVVTLKLHESKGGSLLGTDTVEGTSTVDLLHSLGERGRLLMIAAFGPPRRR